jgi:uncharacterized protein (DUF697 family)
MTEEQRKKCHGIIHAAATAAAAVGAGLAQLPCSDAAVIVPIQVGMIISLGAVFEISITESAAKTVLAETLGTTIGRGISQVLVGWLPGIGNLINASTAAAVTEALGWMVARDFDRRAEERPGE